MCIRDSYWIDHCEITDFLDDSLTMGTSVASAADYITVSNNKIHNTGKALYGFYQNTVHHGQGHVTAFFNELNGAERNPNNRGAEHFHLFNNWIHDWAHEGVVSGGFGVTRFKHLAGNRTKDSVMLSQSNFYESAGTRNQCAETADPYVNYGGWIYADGQSIYNGLSICGTPNHVNENSNEGPGRPHIPYSYNLLPADQVKSYVLQNVGPID